MSTKIYTAINKHIINKIEPHQENLWSHFTNSFENVEVTLDELADSINQGFASCAQHDGKRTNKNFSRTNVLFLDIDDGLSIDDALATSFVKQYASLLHITASHTPEHHRFRLVFQLDRLIEDAEEMCNAIRGLIFKFGADESCKDACRGYFGFKGCNPLILGNTVPNAELDQLIFHGKNKKNLHAQKNLLKSKKKHTSSSTNASTQIFQLDRDHLLKLSSGAHAHLQQLYRGISVHCPHHADNRPSAFVIENKNGVRGVYCHTCKLSFWPNDDKKIGDPYNFYSYEQFVLSACGFKKLPNGIIENQIFEKMKFHISDIQVFNSQYIDKTIPLREGVSFMRSPKGSGKTEWLSQIVKICKQKNKKILLIGHRRSLIIGLAKRLGIDCYLYFNEGIAKFRRPTDCYAVCVDSISNKLDPKMHNYDVIIIDESEQVLTHATSKTVKEKRRSVCSKIFYYLRKAESIILADADLDMITTSTMWDLLGDRKKYYLYMNIYKEQDRKITDFDEYICLVADLVRHAGSGGKYFVSTNSKGEAEALDYLLRKKCNAINVLLVTSETTGKPDVRLLLADVINEIMKYDVVIASPTMGTGIDITFPGKQTIIDGVYGFYTNGVNTHFDIDQQLSRVRHPGFIKTWISNIPCDNETDIDVIKEAMKDSDAIEEIIIGYKENGDPFVDEEYLNLYSIVESINNASKNNLKNNFLALRENNGWKVEHVDCELLLDQDLSEVYDDLVEVKTILKQQKINNIVNANVISDDDYKSLSKLSKNTSLSVYEQNAMRRWEIEKFYKIAITENLVILDDNAKYRDKISLLETYLENFTVLKIYGKLDRGHKLLPDRNFLSTKKSALTELLKRSGICNGKSKIDLSCKIMGENLKDFSEFCQKNSAQINRLLGINVAPKDLEQKPISTLSRVLDVIGLNLIGTRSKKAGITTYSYKLNEKTYKRAIHIVHRRKNARDDAIVDKRVLSRIVNDDAPTAEEMLANPERFSEPQKHSKIVDLDRARILFKKQEKIKLANERLKQKQADTIMNRDFIGEFKNNPINSKKISVKQKLLSTFKNIEKAKKRKHVESFVKY